MDSISAVASRSCFVALPFDNRFRNVWDLALEASVVACGLVPTRGDTQRGEIATIMRDVTGLIFEADLVIADITGGNPSVMYELGLAHAAKKRVIIIADEKTEIPYDIQHIRVLIYQRQNLRLLRENLERAILQAISLADSAPEDHFPELNVLTSELAREFEYMRNNMRTVEVTVDPPDAYIFFNDRLLGPSPQTIRINPLAPRNTVSAAVEGFLEHHQDISPEELEAGSVGIALDRLPGTDINKRLAGWLRMRRRDPENPVLMRAISQYLLRSDPAEGLEECKELLRIAPDWYLAHNQMGFALRRDPRFSEPYYRLAIALCPDSHVGYFNLACSFIRAGRFAEALDELRRFRDDPALGRRLAFFRVSTDIRTDSLIAQLAGQPELSKEVHAIADGIVALGDELHRPPSAMGFSGIA
ncbi:MAG: hypothetical protein K1X67_07250 [Fimbriimonadaceae bacterium]|nr:hypothetical protein [Fimbriimonadaceae bacterium]